MSDLCSSAGRCPPGTTWRRWVQPLKRKPVHDPRTARRRATSAARQPAPSLGLSTPSRVRSAWSARSNAGRRASCRPHSVWYAHPLQQGLRRCACSNTPKASTRCTRSAWPGRSSPMLGGSNPAPAVQPGWRDQPAFPVRCGSNPARQPRLPWCWPMPSWKHGSSGLLGPRPRPSAMPRTSAAPSLTPEALATTGRQLRAGPAAIPLELRVRAMDVFMRIGPGAIPEFELLPQTSRAVSSRGDNG